MACTLDTLGKVKKFVLDIIRKDVRPDVKKKVKSTTDLSKSPFGYTPVDRRFLYAKVRRRIKKNGCKIAPGATASVLARKKTIAAAAIQLNKAIAKAN